MKIFVRSTYQDLIRHREKVSESLELLGQEIGRMELFGARPDTPLDASLSEVDGCDLFVGIYAHRYGFVPRGSPISISEAEVNRAIETGKPILCFVVDEDHPWPPKFVDSGTAGRKLRALKSRLASEFVRETFTTPEDLAAKVVSSVEKYLVTRKPAREEDNPKLLTLRTSADLSELLDRTLRELELLTETDYNQVFLASTSAYSRHLVAVADSIASHKQRYRIATFAGLLGTVFSSGEPLNAKNVREIPGYFQAVLDTRSELVVPIRSGFAVIGVLNSESGREDHYSDQICRQVQQLADALGDLLPRFGWSPGLSEDALPWIRRMPAE